MRLEDQHGAGFRGLATRIAPGGFAPPLPSIARKIDAGGVAGIGDAGEGGGGAVTRIRAGAAGKDG